MARITVKTLGECTPKEKRRLAKLTLDPYSGMSIDVLDRRSNLHLFHCFLARIDKTIVGWAVVFPSNMSIDSSTRGPLGSNNVYIFVQPRKRRKGIGKQLVGRVEKWLEKHKSVARVFTWDTRSRGFYEQLGSRSPLVARSQW